MRANVSLNRLTIALAALLCTVGAQAATTKHKAAEKPAAAANTSAPSAADKARVEALMQYQHDLVSVLALRGDAEHLLGAALLAHPLPKLPPELSFHRLSERAAQAPGAGPGVTWLRLTDCDPKASDCPNADMFTQLQKQAPDNAAVWMLAMDAAAEKNDATSERDALAKAAASKKYDDYFGVGLQALAASVVTLPPRPETMTGAEPGEPSTASGVQLLIAFGIANQHPQPSLKPLLELCGADQAEKDDALKADCLKIAHNLEWGGSPLGRAVGLHLRGELDAAAKAATDRDSLNLAWQLQNYGALGFHALDDDKLAQQLLNSARNGGTELSLVLSSLRGNGISTEAPDGWQPAQPQAAPVKSGG
ncbi:MAG: hypothetical protein ABIY40_00645 [Rhodanobacteraceae bacterium]|nr:hypothetical protein [Pseudomonadota bacterium]